MVMRTHALRATALVVFGALNSLAANANHVSGHFAGGSLVAQNDHSGHHADTAAAVNKDLSEASKEMEAAAMKMHKDMAITYTNDIDVDFVRGMIPHHQGAIDQALVFIKYTKDLRLRRLALGIIAAQRKEIRFMQRWLKEREQGLGPGEKPASLDDPADPADAVTSEPAR